MHQFLHQNFQSKYIECAILFNQFIIDLTTDKEDSFVGVSRSGPEPKAPVWSMRFRAMPPKLEEIDWECEWENEKHRGNSIVASERRARIVEDEGSFARSLSLSLFPPSRSREQVDLLIRARLPLALGCYLWLLIYRMKGRGSLAGRSIPVSAHDEDISKDRETRCFSNDYSGPEWRSPTLVFWSSFVKPPRTTNTTTEESRKSCIAVLILILCDSSRSKLRRFLSARISIYSVFLRDGRWIVLDCKCDRWSMDSCGIDLPMPWFERRTPFTWAYDLSLKHRT